MNYTSIGLLDEQIEIDSESAKQQKIVRGRLVQKTQGFKSKTDYERFYPAFQKLCADDQEIRIRMQQGLAWSNFMVKVMADSRSRGTRNFFTQSQAHRVMFHVLFAYATNIELYAESRDEDPTAIGMQTESLFELMQASQTKCGKRRCAEILKEAVDAGFVKKSKWRDDRRVKLYWLTPEAKESYLTYTLELFADAKEGLPEARRLLLAAKKINPNYDLDVRNKIQGAIKLDKKLCADSAHDNS